MKTKFKSIFAATTVVLLSGVLVLNGCKKPNEGLTYFISSAVFKYTASIKFQDPANGNAVPAGLTLTLKGTDAASVYDFSGFKNLKLNGGVVTMGVNPSVVPTTGKDITVTVLAEAPGYRDENVTITFTAAGDPTIPMRTVSMLNLVNVSDGVAISSKTSTVSAGIVAAPIVGTTPTSSTATQTATVTIPSGTQLKDASGTVVPTGSATLSVVNLDVEKPSSVQFVPGNDLIQTAVINGVPQQTVFTPGAITTVELTAANGTEIKNFSQPISVNVSLDPTSVNPASDGPIQAGDAVDFYSYDAAKDLWTLESSGVIQSSGGSLFTNLSVTHLTTFMTCFKGKKFCTNLNNVTIVGGNNGYLPPAGSTDVYKVETYYVNGRGQKKVISSKNVKISTTENQILVAATQGSYSIDVLDANKKVVGSQTFTSCASSGTLTVNLTPPTVDFPSMTIAITAVCPANGTLNQVSSTAPPGTNVQYKETGTSNWAILGSVNNNGELVTNALNRNKRYDFQAFIAQAGPTAPNGLTKGWTDVAISGTTIVTGQNGSGLNVGTIDYTKSSVTFSPDNKTGIVKIVYQVNPVFCK